MEQEIHITLRYNLAIGDVNLNEIIYRLNELKNLLMLWVTEKIVQDYDDIITERLSRTDIFPSKARRGLGQHIRKGDPEGLFCRGRKVRKRGYRKDSRKISTVFGDLFVAIREVECGTCGARVQPCFRCLENWSLCSQGDEF